MAYVGSRLALAGDGGGGGEADLDPPSGDVHAKLDRLIKEQERAIRLREISIAVTGASIVIGLVRVGDILRKLRERK